MNPSLEIESLWGIIGIIAIVIIAIISTYLLVNRIKLDPRYMHLSMYFSQRTDTPKTSNPARPRYIINTKTNEAYWVSTFVDTQIKRKIQWLTFNNEKELESCLKKNNININKRNPTLEELGIQQEYFH